MSIALRLPLPQTARSDVPTGDDTGLWLLAGKISLMFVTVVGYGAIDDGLLGFNLKPTLYLLATFMMIATTIALSPRGRALRISFPLGIVLYFAWWMSSSLWSAFPQGFTAATIPEATTVVGLVVLAGFLPRDVVVRVLVNSYYVIIVLVLLATVAQPSKSLNSLSIEGAVAVRGWHGAFLHKNIMTACLIFGTILVLTIEHRKWVRNSAILLTLALTLLGNSGTGLAAFAVVMIMSWWLDQFLSKNKRMGVAFAFSSVLITAVGAWMTTSLLPAILSLYGKDLSFSGRTQIWTGVIRAIYLQPWQGYGYGGVWINGTREPTLSINKPLGFYVLHSHNGFLEIALRLGVIGLALWLFAFGSTLIAAWRVLRVDPQVGKAAVLLCVVMLVFAVSEITVFGIWFGLLGVFRILAARAYAPLSRKYDPTPSLRRTAPPTGSIYTTPTRRT